MKDKNREREALERVHLQIILNDPEDAELTLRMRFPQVK